MKEFVYKITHNRKMLWVILFLNICTYYLFAYQTERTNFIQVLVLYSFLFGSFLYFYKSDLTLKSLIFIGIAFRLVLIFAIPNLSDDFYRFLWDGRAIFNGINPYLILPENNPQLIKDGVNLYKGMGKMNGSHYTCYPPLNQLAFTLSALISDSDLLISTIVMRLSLICADLVTLFYGIKILKHFNLPVKKILLYFINPFIIIELTGNFHYEGMMIAFLAISLYYLFKNKFIISALFLGCSVSIKLVPLIFIPFLFRRLGFLKTLFFGLIVLLVNILLFLPFMSLELYENFISSIELYFQNFEFNASIYYIIREVGFYFKGYNIIHTVGKITPFVTIAFVLSLSFFRKNEEKEKMMSSMLLGICFYYFLSSIVHPWYVAIPLFLSLFTRFNFPLLWSYCIVFSYSAYVSKVYHENLWLVSLEYILVFGCLICELFFKQKLKKEIVV